MNTCSRAFNLKRVTLQTDDSFTNESEFLQNWIFSPKVTKSKLQQAHTHFSLEITKK